MFCAVMYLLVIEDRKVFSISAAPVHIRCVIEAFTIIVLPQEMMGD